MHEKELRVPLKIAHGHLIACGVCLLPSLNQMTQSADTQPARFFVSPDGNDAWSGRREAPSPGNPDGPFASLERARDEIRKLKTTGALKGGATVLVRGGFYFLKAPFTLAPEDSGSADAPIVYAACQGEKPVFSGGRRVAGWKAVNGHWETTLPDVQNGAWYFSQLFVDGEPRTRPRLPAHGYYFVAGEAESAAEAQGRGFDRFAFWPGDIGAGWHNLGDVEVLAFHIWSASRLRPATVDEAAHVVIFTGGTCSAADWQKFLEGGRYIIENVREALREPGQWYLDRQSGVLTYLPRPGEDPNKTQVIAPHLERLVSFTGDVAKRAWVEHISLRGLTFEDANYALPQAGHSSPQAEVDLGAALEAVGMRNCTLEHCAVTHVGEYAIELGAGCKNNRILDCEFTDMGAGGVKIGETNLEEDEEAVADHNVVSNCLIERGGRLQPGAVGVWIGQSPENTVEHNTIYDLYYTGISVGWSWGYGKSLAHHNTIAFNDISRIGQGVLSDMGGIYMLGAGPGNVVDHNLIHDVRSFGYGGWGIYFDEGASGIVAENNIAYRTKSAGFHQHYGRDNVVRNNIFAFGREAQMMLTRVEDHLSFTAERNIVLWKDAPLFGLNVTGSASSDKFDYNLYWRSDGKPVRFAGNQTLEQWRAQDQDIHSLIADPLFVDPLKDDYRLKPDSPAFGLGFHPIDLSTIGRHTGQ